MSEPARERPRRRHRRVVRPATGGDPGPEPSGIGHDADPDDERQQDSRGSDRWWQEQRPPHWE